MRRVFRQPGGGAGRSTKEVVLNPFRPRVVLVCGTFAPQLDGVADYTRLLAGALRRRGLDARIAAAADGPGAGNGSVRLADRWNLRGTVRAARALRRLDADVVHVQFAPSAYGFSPAVGVLPTLLPALLPGRRPGLPVVTSLHEYGWWQWPARFPAAAALERLGWWDRETGLLGPRSAALVTTNAGHAGLVYARLGREPTVIPIGPNVPDAGWDRTQARRDVRERLGLPAAAPLLVFFGFVHPVKGVRYLLDAVAHLRPRYPTLHLVVAGGFTSLALPEAEAAAFRAELAKHAADAGVSDAVTFTGHLPARDVSRLLAAADAAVLPMTAGVTTKSGALLAAFAHNVPTIVTAAGDPDPELVDGHTVVLVRRRRDGVSIAAAVERVLSDPYLARRVAGGGAALARQRSWDAIAARHVALYRGVLQP